MPESAVRVSAFSRSVLHFPSLKDSFIFNSLTRLHADSFECIADRWSVLWHTPPPHRRNQLSFNSSDRHHCRRVCTWERFRVYVEKWYRVCMANESVVHKAKSSTDKHGVVPEEVLWWDLGYLPLSKFWFRVELAVNFCIIEEFRLLVDDWNAWANRSIPGGKWAFSVRSILVVILYRLAALCWLRPPSQMLFHL